MEEIKEKDPKKYAQIVKELQEASTNNGEFAAKLPGGGVLGKKKEIPWSHASKSLASPMQNEAARKRNEAVRKEYEEMKALYGAQKYEEIVAAFDEQMAKAGGGKMRADKSLQDAIDDKDTADADLSSI